MAVSEFGSSGIADEAMFFNLRSLAIDPAMLLFNFSDIDVAVANRIATRLPSAGILLTVDLTCAEI